MRKITKKTVEVSAETIAETSKEIYEAFLKKGFTTEQAFQLLLMVWNRGS